jgi:AcrR family transcriptional regulator
MPRKYSMQNRSSAVEDTRSRIVDATMALHNEKGIIATSMQDIADRAGVALATVYRHFPTVDELVPACGGRLMELNPPPSAAVFNQNTSGEKRVRALISALFEHYERLNRPYEVAFAEADAVVPLAAFVSEQVRYFRALVTEATRPFSPSQPSLDLAVGLSDFRVWQSLTHHGLDTSSAADAITEIICSVLSGAPSSGRGRA